MGAAPAGYALRNAPGNAKIDLVKRDRWVLVLGFSYRLAIVLAGFSLAAPNALALGGAAARADSGLSNHIVMVLSSRTNAQGVCTGTVIARDIILTAAHCVHGAKQLAVAYFENGSPVLQKVIAQATNPGFSSEARVSIDMALVKLEGTLPDRFQPIALDRGLGAHEIGINRVIAGFGIAIDRDEKSAGTLRSAKVTVLPRLYPRFLRLGLEDAANLNEIAICRGDSGGPVLERASGSSLLVGVVYGVEKFPNARTCGTTAQAVRVAPQLGWIDDVLDRWARGLPAPIPARPNTKRVAQTPVQ
jgi:S1-C subfamily serine protease